MLKHRKTTDTLGEQGILGDEQAAHLRSELDELKAVVADLSGRLHAQFTTIAAHAEIARQQADFAREEARADVDRSRDVLIGLIEQLRSETAGNTHHVAGSAPGPSIETLDERFEEVDTQIRQIDRQVATCLARQDQLAEMVAAALDAMLTEQQDRPVPGLSLT